MKPEKRFLFILFFVIGMNLLPIGVYGQKGAGAPPPTPLADQTKANTSLVKQPLIPEGVFAVQLVKVLKVGQTQDEAQAESILSAIGIEPKNGWIAEYPVTPPVIGEIEKGVARAADDGKLRMGKDQALKAVGDLKANLGLSANLNASSTTQVRPNGQPTGSIIYKYVDRNGVIHFTNQFDSIPKEYQGQTSR